jgi:hypothetical protein
MLWQIVDLWGAGGQKLPNRMLKKVTKPHKLPI